MRYYCDITALPYENSDRAVRDKMTVLCERKKKRRNEEMKPPHAMR